MSDAQAAQEQAMMIPEPTANHEWLLQLVGEWDFENSTNCGPDAPEMKSSGHESVSALGKLWIVCEGRSAMPDGTPVVMQCTLGYDPQRACFVGNWVGSMMCSHWVYEGELDSARKVLTLSAEGPSFSGEGTSQYRDSIELVDANHRVLRSSMQDETGAWIQFMEAHYTRK